MGAKNLHHFGQGRHKYCLVEDFTAFEITDEEAQEIVDANDGDVPEHLSQYNETWYETPEQGFVWEQIKDALKYRLDLAGFQTFDNPPYDRSSLFSYPGVIVGKRSFDLQVEAGDAWTRLYGNCEVTLTSGYHEGASVNVFVEAQNGDFSVDEKTGDVELPAPKDFARDHGFEIYGAALESLVKATQKRLQKMVDDILDDADAAIHPICDGFKGDFYAFQTKEGVSKVGQNSRSERELAWHYREFVLSDPTLDRKVRSEINNMDYKKLLTAARKKGFTVVSRNEYFEYVQG
jgi:hypothetical protein